MSRRVLGTKFRRNEAIFLFNGPPRSGKDSAALFCRDKFVGLLEKFAWPLKKAFAATVDGYFNPTTGNVRDNNVDYEATKDDIIPWLGVSYRQWQINFSELHMKPLYGIDIFGRLLAQRLQNFVPPVWGGTFPIELPSVFISDSGFADEAKYLANEYGEENILLVRCHRPGYDFTGDSRSYLYDILPNEVDVVNDASLEEYQGKIQKLVREFLSR